jgi:hypothetical protein
MDQSLRIFKPVVLQYKKSNNFLQHSSYTCNENFTNAADFIDVGCAADFYFFVAIRLQTT